MTPPPLVGFGSLKGGVGKTTVALCAARLLSAPAVAPGLPTFPVVLIDADVVGTELSWGWEDPAFTTADVSLQELIAADPPNALGSSGSWAKLRGRLEATPQASFLIPSYPAVGVREVGPWRRVLERSRAIVTERMLDLFDRIRAKGYAVVVDLPAFDAGFAHYVRHALRERDGKVFTVTDPDFRSLFSILGHNDSDPKAWWWTVVNRWEFPEPLPDPPTYPPDNPAILFANVRTFVGGAAAPGSTAASVGAALSSVSPIFIPESNDLANKSRRSGSTRDEVATAIDTLAKLVARLPGVALRLRGESPPP